MPALERLRAEAGRDVALMGYCMGGTLAAGVAARAPGASAALVTLGAPWDFAGGRGLAGALRLLMRAEGPEGSAARLAALGQAFGLVPDALFQTLFALIDPMQAAVKFQRLARMDPGSPEAERFVAIEDWLADAVAMPAPAAEDLLIRWQLENAPAEGRWRLLGGQVTPGAVTAPTLAFCGRADTIAPPEVAEPLAAAIPGARLVRPATGHVGMVVGRAARAQVWGAAARFLAAHAG
jgi:polyhydroxyalkanoate synthase